MNDISTQVTAEVTAPENDFSNLSNSIVITNADSDADVQPLSANKWLVTRSSFNGGRLARQLKDKKCDNLHEKAQAYAAAVVGHGLNLDDKSLIGRLAKTNFRKDLAKDQEVASLYPPAIRAIGYGALGLPRSFIFERPPHHRTISLHPVGAYVASNRSDSELYHYDVFVPWTAYYVNLTSYGDISRIHVYVTDGPISSPSDKLYTAPLLNLFHHGELCKPGNHQHEGVKYDIASLSQQAFNMVWNSGFNTDLIWGVTQNLPAMRKFLTDKGEPDLIDAGVVDFYDAWSKMSPQEVLAFPWGNHSVMAYGPEGHVVKTRRNTLGTVRALIGRSKSTRSWFQESRKSRILPVGNDAANLITILSASVNN